MLVRQGVKGKIQPIQHVANLHWRHGSRYIREAHYITEEDSDIVVGLTILERKEGIVEIIDIAMHLLSVVDITYGSTFCPAFS